MIDTTTGSAIYVLLIAVVWNLLASGATEVRAVVTELAVL
jgi:hypothetical protein